METRWLAGKAYLFQPKTVLGMDRPKLLVLAAVLVIAVFAVLGTASAYKASTDNSVDPPRDSEKCNGVDDDGDGQIDEGCPGNPPPPPPPPGAGSCTDGSNNDNHGGADGSDSKSCVKPYSVDYIEGSIWDSDLSNFLNGEDNFFAGFTDMGGDRQYDSATSTSVSERHVQDDYSESDGYWGYGRRGTNSDSGFPAGTVDGGRRIIDAPNPSASSTQRCGDGRENDAGDPASGPDGETGGDQIDSIDCRADWGRQWAKYSIRAPYNDRGSTGMKCEDDQADCNNPEVYCDSGDGSYPGCSDSTCGTITSASCWFTDDNRYMEGNTYWYTSGDYLRRNECTRDSGPVESTEAECGPATDYSTESACASWNYDQYGDRTSCARYNYWCSSNRGCSERTYDEEGYYRSWDLQNSINCNRHNTVDGGGDERSGVMGNDPAATYTDFTAYSDNSWGSSPHNGGKVWCGHESHTTVDADGAYGYGDGFVVIEDGRIVATMSPDGSDNVGQRVFVDGSDTGRNELWRINTNCGDKNVCIKYADFYTSTGGWSSISAAIRSDESRAFTPDESYSVCKTINYINEMHGDGREIIDCDYERGGDVSPLPEACGDEDNEQLILMEGTEVENSVTEDYLAHEQKCVDWAEDTDPFGDSLDGNACVSKGNAYSEGTVLQISRSSVSGYEKQSDSTDWEVCLNINGNGDSKRWDNNENRGSGQDYGGEWYDLDNEVVNSYLRGSGNSLITGGDSSDINDVAYYWQTNENPYHASYNPEGGNSGLPLEDDCGPELGGCDDQASTFNGKNPVFYSFLVQDMRDEDYHPQGTDTSPGTFNSIYDGYINKIEDYSDQLEPGMGTTAYGMSSSGADPDSISGQTNVDSSSDAKWHDSMGGVDRADQYAITESLEWAISNRGIPYEPGDTYYHEDYTGFTRSKPGDPSVSKTVKVFGNSFAAVADQSLAGESGTSIEAGDGIWIDPDDMKELTENGQIRGNWRGLLTYSIDITGPDSGLGLNTGDNDGINYIDPGRYYIVHGNIYFEGEADKVDNNGVNGKDEGYGDPATVGESKPLLEPPLCGDDRKEFLMEELGESTKSERLDGAYACADSRDVCVDMSASGSKIFSVGATQQTDEIDENVGRLKNDEEVCAQLDASEKVGQSTPDDVPLWYDQDYTESLCQNQNNLYGLAGLRWIPESEIRNHPHAFTGGIDDDWNERFQQMWQRGAITENYTSRPNKNSWDFSRESPVPTGSINQSRDEKNTSIATLGFCGGDDEGEFLITQRCNTQYCETDNSVKGVADNPNNCILDGSKYPEVSNNIRDLYNPGDKVDFTFSGDTKTISCYDGVWYGDWPVVFNRDQVNVVSGQTRYVTFKIINVENRQVSYDVQLSPGANINDAWVSFRQNGTEFETTLPAQSSKEFNVEIYGGDTSVDNAEIEVIASSKDGDISGFDRVEVDIVPAANSPAGQQGSSRNVPGIGLLQVVVLMMLAGTVYFFTV